MTWTSGANETRRTKINGVEYELESADAVVEKIKEIAKSMGLKSFDVKDVETGAFVEPGDIEVGGDYEIVPYNDVK